MPSFEKYKSNPNILQKISRSTSSKSFEEDIKRLYAIFVSDKEEKGIIDLLLQTECNDVLEEKQAKWNMNLVC